MTSFRSGWILPALLFCAVLAGMAQPPLLQDTSAPQITEVALPFLETAPLPWARAPVGPAARAEEILRRRLTLEEGQTGADVLLHARRWKDIGRVLVRQQKYADAEAIYQRLLAAQEAAPREDETADLMLAETQRLLAECYAAWGRPEPAETLFMEALGHVEQVKRQSDYEYIDLAVYLAPYVAFLRAQGRDVEAEALEQRLNGDEE